MVVEFKVKDDCKKIFFRRPDEVFIIRENGETKLKIGEKKNQNGTGSVETKLWAAFKLRNEYRKVFININKIVIEVEYYLVLNDYLYDKLNSKETRFELLRDDYKEDDIKYYSGNNKDYYKNIIN